MNLGPTELIVLAILIVPAVVAGNVAKGKGHSYWLFVLIGFLLPIVGLIIAAVIPAKEPAGTTRPCPMCAEPIKPEARVCKHCGRDVPQAAAGGR